MDTAPLINCLPPPHPKTTTSTPTTTVTATVTVPPSKRRGGTNLYEGFYRTFQHRLGLSSSKKDPTLPQKDPTLPLLGYSTWPQPPLPVLKKREWGGGGAPITICECSTESFYSGICIFILVLPPNLRFVNLYGKLSMISFGELTFSPAIMGGELASSCNTVFSASSKLELNWRVSTPPPTPHPHPQTLNPHPPSPHTHSRCLEASSIDEPWQPSGCLDPFFLTNVKEWDVFSHLRIDWCVRR